MRTKTLKVWSACLVVAVSASFGQAKDPPRAEESQPGVTATLLEEDTKAGLELWQTRLGRLWIPRPGHYVIKHLEWEQAVEKVYDHPLVHVRPGDVVVDCGAHIGGFTRVALQAGARLVVAIEPERANLEAFRRNLGPELKQGRVRLIEKGIWNTSGKLPLHVSHTGDSHSMVVLQSGGMEETIEVTTLDALVTEMKLPRVDFIKMDIEGAERNGLKGAARTIERWKPRLAISSYHIKGDPAALAALVWECHQDYLIDTKDLVQGPGGQSVPKVLFFH